MKRVCTNLFVIMLGAIVPLSSAFGQDKKNEQKIKIVVDDGSGEKTVLDTTFKDGKMPETINLKDGKTIFIGKSGKGMTHIESGDGPEKVFVTVRSEGENEENEVSNVVIMSSDSMKWTASPSGKKKHIYVYSNNSEKDSEPVIVTARANARSGKEIDYKEDRVIIMKDGYAVESGKDGKTFDVIVESGDNEKDSDLTKYIIAKDGVVVTVESNDEAKAKDIIKTIEDKLGVK